ncbi:type I restriction endonuclease [Weissella soli]|uniref:Type I restriction enzyme R protein N-terminal domain-containing protein n=1 Tax=Weissella soli TaxID=155866 RepID=A0A288Q6X0_9LACO|nr:type I restriction enzyme HsdR N-terminal domain-containing protein [Weissella soli]AOT56595.1 hypothetical protein WSWS_00964 [Weissella soli]NKY83047.1 endonuclease [Weissella soli]RDL12160.1 hypothetical protein DFP99_0593 [Weissella soli]GEN92603.1 endonuclease [Weissella soli]
MDKQEFSTKIKQFSKRIEQFKNTISNEEQTKNSLILPFFSALGYDVFNPMEFIPEFTADVSGIKKGERVDFAIKLDDQVVILVEAKELSAPLDKHTTQINRYFNVVDAKFAIITNGKEYRFYTDLEKENIMDGKPFLTVDLTDIKDSQISELFKFVKDNFDSENITSTASDLKYVSQIKAFFTQAIDSPNDDFVRLVLDEIGYDGVKRQNIIEEFKPMVSRAVQSLISERVNDRLSSALNSTSVTTSEEVVVSSDEAVPEKTENEIVTTADELEVYTITKLILNKILPSDRIFYRDNTTYFNILIDDNNRRWVLRAYFNSSRSWIVLNDQDNTKIEFKQPIDIYEYASKISDIAQNFV